MAGATFCYTGLTFSQLYSTASYQANDLQGISLYNADLTGWNLANQNLAGANLSSDTLVNASLMAQTSRGRALRAAP